MTETFYMLACRPVDWRAFARRYPPGLLPETPPPVYPDSITLPCAQCRIDILIGPRQLHKLTSETNAAAFCLACAAMVYEPSIPIINLGNPNGRVP